MISRIITITPYYWKFIIFNLLMPDSHNRIVAILVKYALQQQLTEEEGSLLRDWQARSAEHNALPENLRNKEWREAHRRELEQAPTDEMWANIRDHIRESRGETESGPALQPYPRISRRRVRMAWVAAALIIGIIVTAGRPMWRWVQGRPPAGPPEKPAVAMVAAAVAPADNDDFDVRLTTAEGVTVDIGGKKPGEAITVGNTVVTMTEFGFACKERPAFSEQLATIAHQIINGAMQVLQLGKRRTKPFCLDFSDGSRIWVNVGSRLKYPLDLRGGGELTLEGEAWFEIAHEMQRPLLVKTGQGEGVTVLGTSFSVRRYPKDTQCRVELYSGKVRVKSRNDSLVLRPASIVVMTEDRAPEVKQLEAPLTMPEWMQAAGADLFFNFKDTPLLTALREVANFYSMTVSNPYNVKGIPISGRLPCTRALEATLHALEKVESGKVRLTRKGNSIFILPNDAGS